MGLANLRDWGGLVGRNGADVGTTWVMCGVGWVRAGERVAREGDAFFGVRGREWAEGVRWGVRGTSRYTLAISHNPG